MNERVKFDGMLHDFYDGATMPWDVVDEPLFTRSTILAAIDEEIAVARDIWYPQCEAEHQLRILRARFEEAPDG